MSQNPEALSPNAPLEEAARRILKTRYNGFPVVDEEGRLLGLVEVEDLLPRLETIPFSTVKALRFLDEWLDGDTLAEIYRRYQQIPVRAVMRTEVPTVGPDDPIDQALELFFSGKSTRLPVVDEKGRLVGVLSRSDILKVILKEV